MVLFHYMIEILELTDQHSYFHVGVDPVNRRFGGATFIHRKFLRCAVRCNGLVEKPHGYCLVSIGSQKKINRFPFLVYGEVKVFPFAVDLHVVSSIRQLPPTGRLYFLNMLSITGRIRIAQRLTIE